MTLKSKGLDALFGSRHGILFCTHLEPSRWWSCAGAGHHTANGAGESGGRPRELLIGAEILRARGEGDGAEYQANSESAFFAELQAMMAKTATRDAPAGMATILVVDDQAATLKVARILLESFGYEVLAAANGQEAMILFRRHQQQIRLLLTDVVMPDITGPQLAERLRRINPDMRVIYMSGYPAEELRGPGVLFLAKPFNPAGLSKAVREALDVDEESRHRRPQVLAQKLERALAVDRVRAVEELDLRCGRACPVRVVEPADLGVLVGHPFVGRHAVAMPALHHERTRRHQLRQLGVVARRCARSNSSMSYSRVNM